MEDFEIAEAKRIHTAERNAADTKLMEDPDPVDYSDDEELDKKGEPPEA